MTDSASALPHWSHLWCKTCVAMDKVWENPIRFQGLKVHLEVPASSSNGIGLPVPQLGPAMSAQHSPELVESIGILWFKENM